MLGNTHEELPQSNNKFLMEHRSNEKQNKHKWTAFVQFKDEYMQMNIHKLIHKVTFELHPTFKPNIREIILNKHNSNKAIKVSGIGYGFFDIPITIQWRPETGLNNDVFIHELCLYGDGKWGTTNIKINKYVLNDIL